MKKDNMKKTFLLMFLQVSLHMALVNCAAYGADRVLTDSLLLGTYAIQGLDVQYQAEMTLTKEPLLRVDFMEKSEAGSYPCVGVYTVSPQALITSRMYCGEYLTNDQLATKVQSGTKPDYTQEIDLSLVPDQDLEMGVFKATVKSSLYNNIPLHFEFSRKRKDTSELIQNVQKNDQNPAQIQPQTQAQAQENAELVPGTFINNNGCKIEILKTTDPDLSILNFSQDRKNNKGGYGNVILNFKKQEAVNFGLCKDLKYPIAFEKIENDKGFVYSISCGNTLKAINLEMQITLDKHNGKITDLEFSDKVVKYSVPPGAYLPGIQISKANIQCGDLKQAQTE